MAWGPLAGTEWISGGWRGGPGEQLGHHSALASLFMVAVSKGFYVRSFCGHLCAFNRDMNGMLQMISVIG